MEPTLALVRVCLEEEQQQERPLPPTTTEQLRALRMKYNAAYTAYLSCANALSRASMERRAPSAELLEQEAKALRELTEARAKLLAAMREMR